MGERPWRLRRSGAAGGRPIHGGEKGGVTVYELHRGEYTISTEKSRLDMEAIVAFLGRAYWAQGRPRNAIARSIENSLCFGLYAGERQVGFARVITDYAIFAYLCDVFIDEQCRGNGLGKWLMSAIMGHPDLQGLRRWLLATRDAHGLYKQFGWTELREPGRWMEVPGLSTAPS